METLSAIVRSIWLEVLKILREIWDDFANGGKREKALQLSDVDNMTGLQFEHYVARLLRHRGYQASVTAASGDFGVDIVAKNQTESIAVQVKRQSQNVSRHAVSDAVAGRMHYQCTSAMVVTNRFFTDGAQELARTTDCRLVNRNELSKWIVSFQSEQNQPNQHEEKVVIACPGCQQKNNVYFSLITSTSCGKCHRPFSDPLP